MATGSYCNKTMIKRFVHLLGTVNLG